MKPKTAILILWICWIACVVGNGILVGMLTGSVLAGLGGGAIVTLGGAAAVMACMLTEDDE